MIESAKILIEDELTTAHLFLEDGRIKRISKLPPRQTADLKINATGLIALPGMIDAHVHLRDLEFAYKETFETGTQAAAVGGFTTVLDMPNTRPPTISNKALTGEDHACSRTIVRERRLPSGVGRQRKRA